ncbi:MAG: hypothetical protein ACOC0Z_07025 [Halohasta sp.]
MYRRSVCRTTAAAAVLGLAGCLGGGSGSGSNDSDPDDPNGNDSTTNDTATDSETDVIDNNRIKESTLTRTGDCSEAGEATVSFDENDPEVTVTGCVTGHNGCAEPVVDDASEADGVFQVVIGEADLSEPGTACTEALVQRGYELRLRFVDDLPSTIEVVHDDATERSVVATADRP